MPGPLAKMLMGGDSDGKGDGKEDSSWLSRQAKPILESMDKRLAEARKEMEPILERVIETQVAVKKAVTEQNEHLKALIKLTTEQNALLGQLVADVNAAKK